MRDVASCEICLAATYYTRPTSEIQYYEIPETIGKVVSIDLFRSLPTAQRGLRYILVLMDQFSKLVKFYPTVNKKVETIMKVLYRNWRSGGNIIRQGKSIYRWKMDEFWKRKGVCGKTYLPLQSAIKPRRESNKRIRTNYSNLCTS